MKTKRYGNSGKRFHSNRETEVGAAMRSEVNFQVAKYQKVTRLPTSQTAEM